MGRSILRRGKLLVFVIVLLNILALFGVRGLTPRYTASADLLVGPREEQVVDLKAVLSGLSGSSDVIESEIQVLRSRQIARNVVRALRLDQKTEFNPSLQKPGPFHDALEGAGNALLLARDTAMAQLARWGIQMPPSSPTLPSPESTAGAVEPLDPLSAPVDRFLAQLDVASKGRSRVITISFTSTDPVLAAKVPNAVADAYVANQLRAKTEATSQAHKWLDERVAEMRDQLLSADQAVEAYRKRAGIVPIRDTTLLNQQISEAGQELMRAREQTAVAKSRQMSMAIYNPNAMGLNRELAAARAREQMLEANLATLRQQVDIGSQSEIGLRALQREADADRNLFDRLLTRARETKIQSGLQQADATIISRAERPGEQSFPKPALILPMYFIASLITAVLLVLWLESLDRGFLDPDQLESTLGIPAIGAIPLIKRGFRRRFRVDAYCVTHPRSTFAESIRNLHTSLLLSGHDEEVPKTVLLASSLPGEGKSSITTAMAGLMASYGKRVVVVDCDLRNPMVHKIFNMPRQPGLTDCLAGRASLEETLRCDPVSSVYFLAAGNDSRVSPDLFASFEMRELVHRLSTEFDLVLLDGGPVLGIADTRHLCRVADKTIFVIRWQDTRCAAALLGLRQLVDAGANVAGALLTMVDPKHYRKYSPVGVYRRRLALYLGS